MNEKDVVRLAMENREMSQTELAKAAGYKSQSNITGLLNRGKTGGMQIGILLNLLKSMDYRVDIVDNQDESKKWTLDGKDSDGTSWYEMSDGTYKCPRCGNISEKASKFCPDCGHKFKKYDN